MIYLAQFLSKSFEKKDIFCYTICVNTGRNVMAQFSFRQGLVTFFGAMTVGLASCDTKGGPTPNPGGNGGTKPTEYKIDSVASKLDIIADIGNSAFTDNGISDDAGNVYYGLGSRVNSKNSDKVSTGVSGYDNIKFNVKYNRENMGVGTNSVKNGEYYVRSQKSDEPILSYEPAEKSGYFKTITEIDEENKRKVVKVIKQINVFVKEASGIRIMGSRFANDEVYKKYLDNCASTKSTAIYSSMNRLDVNATSQSVSPL